jgi:hypothetical protein
MHLEFLPRYACMRQHPLLAFVVSRCEVFPGIEDHLRGLLVDKRILVGFISTEGGGSVVTHLYN